MKRNKDNSNKVYILPDFDTYCDVSIQAKGKEDLVRAALNEAPVKEDYGQNMLHTVDEVTPGMKIYNDWFGRAIIIEVGSESIFPFVKIISQKGDKQYISIRHTKFSIVYGEAQ